MDMASSFFIASLLGTSSPITSEKYDKITDTKIMDRVLSTANRSEKIPIWMVAFQSSFCRYQSNLRSRKKSVQHYQKY